MDGGGKTVNAVVAELDDLSLVLELGDGAHRTEDLFLHDLHVVTDIGEDGGLNEVSLVTVTLTADLDGGTILLTRLDVAHDTIELELRNLRSLEGVGSKWVANLVLLSALLESLEELVIDALLDKDTSSGAAALAVVVVDTEVDPADGLLDIGIVENDVGALATQFEGDRLEVGSGSSLHDGAANESRSGESNLVNVHVGRDGSTGNLAETGEKVEDTRRETGLLDQVGENKSRERGLLSSLHDNGVASSQSRSDLPSKHEEGEVPGDDLTNNTKLAHSVSIVISEFPSTWWHLQAPGECS